ncbi:hypothetical protein RM780_14220 [Streptomyces sp. DSM 44917]|uniref:Uncharacterized protein n=1 Tax=Streptomyces boetiae TaxID=3075541 RepID=A0ABU2L9F2_9ACTN|nr:hypothetical protein [Streptomyces sp. DSM 44917]MDT0308111.1 hypothetical protein [Streptomyces sp. DSM 44917]
MRWSDMRPRPNDETRAARAMAARAGWLLATATLLTATLLLLR